MLKPTIYGHVGKSSKATPGKQDWLPYRRTVAHDVIVSSSQAGHLAGHTPVGDDGPGGLHQGGTSERRLRTEEMVVTSSENQAGWLRGSRGVPHRRVGLPIFRTSLSTSASRINARSDRRDRESRSRHGEERERHGLPVILISDRPFPRVKAGTPRTRARHFPSC